MVGSLITLFTFAAVIVWYVANEWVKSEKKEAVLDDDYNELIEVSRNDKKAKDNEASIRNDYATGKPRRMQGKYDID
jgi:hypothetical protein